MSMDIENITSGYYKYNLDSSLSPVRAAPSRQDFLIIDMVMGVKTSQKLPAPRNIGEYKHTTVDDKSVRTVMEENIPVPVIRQSN